MPQLLMKWNCRAINQTATATVSNEPRPSSRHHEGQMFNTAVQYQSRV